MKCVDLKVVNGRNYLKEVEVILNYILRPIILLNSLWLMVILIIFLQIFASFDIFIVILLHLLRQIVNLSHCVGTWYYYYHHLHDLDQLRQPNESNTSCLNVHLLPFGSYAIRLAEWGFAGMYFLEDGTVRCCFRSDGGEQEVSRMTKGSYFGELGLITHKPRAVSVYAVGDVRVACEYFPWK